MSLLGDDQRSIQERLSQLFDGCVEWSAADWANVAAFAARHSELDDEAYRSLVRDLGKSPLVTVDDESDTFYRSDLDLEHMDYANGDKP